MAVYVDNILQYKVNSNNINTNIATSTGSHYIVVQSWDSSGNIQQQPITVTVSGSVSSGPAVSVSSPTAGSTVGSPVHVVASATSSSPVVAMAVYVDDVMQYKVSSNNIDTNVPTSTGSHNFVVQSWDLSGNVQKQQIPVTVSNTTGGGAGGPTIPSNAKVFSDIDQMTGWESCDACAGSGGNGPSTAYSMTQNQSSPSIDGKSTIFFLGGTTPYAAALWWKQLGADFNLRNFVYDLYFYVKNPNAPQALEFDMNQSGGGQKWIFGTQCDYKDHKDWDVWDTRNRAWIKTGIPCTMPQAYTWNHLVLEFQRTSDGLAKFIAVTLNGNKSYINRTYAPIGSSASELNVAFQMDGNNTMTNYSVWLDKVKMSAW